MSLLNLVLGRKLSSGEQNKKRIGIFSGLPALGLDGLSSSAYGPEAALTVLLPLGVAGLAYVLPITLLIVVLLAMLYFSYRQTIAAYPVNGGAYTVARENLGVWPSLLAAAALMIDYVLTVTVGISAGVAALVSAAPEIHHFTLPLGLGILTIITLLNLRGTGEAGLAFALPTYVFIVTMVVVLGWGVMKAIAGHGHPIAVVVPPAAPRGVEAVGIWILLRSFASGCTAMTGVEAVSNGVSAFKEPTVQNAHRTLTWIVVILAILLIGIGYLAHAYQIAAMDQTHNGYQSVLSQLVGAVAGRGWFYYVTLASVLMVLCLSANTSFVDFPRLCRLISKDDFLPRAFSDSGPRLVYWVGILALAILAGLLLVAFDGITDRLIPLYAVGAFTAFTLSQAGMVMHWRKELGKKQTGGYGAHIKVWVNGVGAAATAIALVIIVAAKFVEGAWITILAIPIMLTLFWSVHRAYRRMEEQLRCDEGLKVHHDQPPIVVIPFVSWNRATRKAIRFAMQLSPDVVAVHIECLEGDAIEREAAKIRRLWAEKVEEPARTAGQPLPRLVLPESPFREFVEPILKEVDKLKQRSPDRQMAVVVPQLEEKHWWRMLLHTGRASRLRNALMRREDFKTVVIEVPWFVAE